MIEAVDISKRYRDHDVLESFHASIETNSLTVITGESGKGKTTLLNILSLLERPDR